LVASNPKNLNKYDVFVVSLPDSNYGETWEPTKFAENLKNEWKYVNLLGSSEINGKDITILGIIGYNSAKFDYQYDINTAPEGFVSSIFRGTCLRIKNSEIACCFLGVNLGETPKKGGEQTGKFTTYLIDTLLNKQDIVIKSVVLYFIGDFGTTVTFAGADAKIKEGVKTVADHETLESWLGKMDENRELFDKFSMVPFEIGFMKGWRQKEEETKKLLTSTSTPTETKKRPTSTPTPTETKKRPTSTPTPTETKKLSTQVDEMDEREHYPYYLGWPGEISLWALPFSSGYPVGTFKGKEEIINKTLFNTKKPLENWGYNTRVGCATTRNDKHYCRQSRLLYNLFPALSKDTKTVPIVGIVRIPYEMSKKRRMKK